MATKKEIQSRPKSSPEVPVRIFGKKTQEKMMLPEYLQVTVSPYLLAQIIHTTDQRRRIRRAHTKQRAEVRGGGRKPWKQKHTGRARHGSIRSPIWVGGGTAFGPRSRKERILPTPKRSRRIALRGALSGHARQGTLEFIRFGESVPTKTREVFPYVAQVRGLLIVLDQAHKAAARALQNIPSVRVCFAAQVTTRDIVQARRVWIDQAALSVIEQRCRVKASPVT
jgi:large subunit ribosomal protein L4